MVLPEMPLPWPCPPVLALHPCIWDVSLEGMHLRGAQKPLGTHSLKASLPKPPAFDLLPLMSLCHRVPFCGRPQSCPCHGGLTQPLLCYGCIGFAWPNAPPEPPNPGFWVLLANCYSFSSQ